ncbi:MAG TPA: class I SAM-dependent methyltransferase [Candidatus Binataceae bacterium]|nr:class I SAM-dependent methyltransferase [Candidatus Binataceae bacterium]
MRWRQAAHIAITRPRTVTYRAGLLLKNGKFRRVRAQSLAGLTGCSATEAERYCREVESDSSFIAEVRSFYRAHTEYFPLPTDFMVAPDGNTMFFSCVALYALVRIFKPARIVETGGTPGKSSAFILRALDRNGTGHLWTVDLPPPETSRDFIPPGDAHSMMPAGYTSGWAIPQRLRERHTVVSGDAREKLVALLESLGQIDVFIHDSDHSYQHMMWEFEAAHRYVRSGGFMWSDDILGHSAWPDFCRTHGLERCDFTSQGAARKP